MALLQTETTKVTKVLCPLTVRSSLKSDSCISAMTGCTLVLHRQSKTHPDCQPASIMDAGWQSGIFCNELVLYVENIRVYSPCISRSSYIEIQGQPKAHAPAQLYQDFICSRNRRLKFIYKTNVCIGQNVNDFELTKFSHTLGNDPRSRNRVMYRLAHEKKITGLPKFRF